MTSVADPGKTNRRGVPALIAVAAVVVAMLSLGAGASAPAQASPPMASATAQLAKPSCGDLKATIVGTPGDDHLVGTSGPDVVVAGMGDDVVVGKGGKDLICGRAGDDVLRGGKGGDTLRGGDGNDRHLGGAGKDQLRGGENDDTLRGGAGDDALDGGPDTDDCEGGSGFNTLTRCEVTTNLAPTATDDTPTTNEDSALDVNVLGNDTDPDGDDLLVTAVNTTGTKGSVTVVGGGTQVRYSPSGQFESLGVGASGADTFGYTVADGQGGADVALVTVAVTGVDDPPTAVGDTKTVAEDSGATTIDVRANDPNPDGGPKTISQVTQPANGTVAVINSGNDLTYTPDGDYCNNGSPTDDFTYTLNGGSTATVKVTVSCVNDPGTAVDDAETVDEDSGTTTIDVQGNDVDVDDGTITEVTQPANGAVAITNGGDDLTYEPDADYCNDPPGTSTDDSTYTVAGGSTATVAVTVDCVDDDPLAVDDAATVTEDDAATTVDVRANDTDIDGGPKTITQVTQPANGTVVVTNSGDDLTYEPEANYCNDGTPTDDFTYTLNDGSTATVAVTVDCVDDEPNAVDDSATVTEDSGANPVDVQANDTDVDGGAKTISSASDPANGTVVLTGGSPGAHTGLTYQPDANHCNDGTPTDDFTYTLNGGSTATVAVTVDCVDDLGTAVDDTATVGEDSGTTTIDVQANDTDVDSGSITEVTQPADGTVAVTNNGDDLTYEPDADFCNDPPGTTTDDFTYTVTGGSTATVAVTVECVDDAPTAVDDSATVAEDDPVTSIDVLTNDTDFDGGPKTISSAADPANGIVVLTGGSPGEHTGLTYEPDPNYCNSGAGPDDTFTYTLNGGSSATVSIEVTCANDAPNAVDDTAEVAEDSEANPVDVLDNDTDVEGDDITISSASDPANGIVVLTGGSPGAHTGLTYEPDPDYCNDPPGTTTDDFTYTVNGGDSATVAVTVDCEDDDPVAVDDTANVTLNDPATAIDVLANDTNVDGGPIAIASVTQPDNGAVLLTGGSPGEHTGLTYEPAADFCDDDTPDIFTYTLTPGGSTATVSVTVACDDPPTAVNDSATVAEDSEATTIDVRANDTDPDNGPITIDQVTEPANGTVEITNGGDDLTYEPDPNFCNDPPGTTTDDFTYALTPGGSTATVSVSVTCVNDAPVAGDDSASVAEDSGATPIDVLANDTDVDGGATTITSATDPANGTVALTGGSAGAHTGLTYQPDANYCNDPGAAPEDTFTYTVNGGDTATVSLTVTCVADPPTIDNSAGDTSYTENAAAVVVDGNVTITNNDGLTITAGSANISDGSAAGQDVLDWVDNNLADIITEGASTNQTLLLTGDGTAAEYEAALEAVTYRNTSDDPSTAPRTITFSIATSAGSPSDAKALTVTAVPDPPTAVNDTATVAEDAAATAVDVLANDTDPDAGPKTITSASDPANGAVVLTGGSAGAHTGLTYQPDPNYCNSQAGGTPDTFTYTLNGGSTATVSVTVTCAPDNPVVDTSTGNTSYTENAAATVIDAGVTVSDVDAGTTITGAIVQITGNYAGAEDVLALANPGSHPLITPSVVGDTLTLTGTASVAAYQAALRVVTYRNGSEAPSTAARTVTFTVTDDTARSGSDTKGLTVTPVDDPPTAVNDSATLLEDAAATAVPVLTNDTDVDAGPKSIGSVTQPANGTVAITGGGTGLTYQPNANYCNDPPGTTLSTFTYTLNGGSSATVSMTVTCVNDAPVADDETFNGTSSAVGNTALVVNDPDDAAPTLNAPKKSISGDILAGDTDIDGPGPLTVTPVTNALTTDGGRVTIEADGDFTYVSDPVDACGDASDSFSYTVEDSGSPELTDTGTVTIAVTGCVWYVNNNDPTGNAGTSVAPFDTMAQAQTASLANHTIFVFDGDNTSTGYAAGFSLKAGQVLTSEAHNLVVGADILWTGIAANRPTLTDNNFDVVDLDDANTVRGFVLDPQGTGGGIGGANGDTGGGTIDNVSITDTGTAGSQPGLELDTTAGTFNVSDLTVSTNGATGVRLNNAGTVNFASAGTISITTSGAAGLIALGGATGTSMGTSVFDTITVTGSSNGGVNLTNTTGTTTFGDLALTTTSGAPPAFGLSNAGTVSVPAAGTTNVSATGGPAVDVTGTTIGTLAFDAVGSANSASDGINLDGLGTGTFSAASTSAITGAGGIAFDLNGGSGDVTFPGTISNGQGSSAEVTGRTGGTVALSGPITESGDTDATQENGGIEVTGNTGGSTVVSNATKAFNTGEDHAIVMGTSDGHTLTLSGGSLDIDTTSGQGLVATTSGTLVVAGTGNAIDSISGTALTVTNTDIGSGGATFQRISAGNDTAAPDPANGIVLNSTGGTGSLTVTGTGTTSGSGGTITNTASDGVVMTSTSSPAFSNLAVSNTGRHGMSSSSTSSPTLTGVQLTNTGNADNEYGLNLLNTSGTLTISSSSFNTAGEKLVYVENTNVNLTINVGSASSFSMPAAGVNPVWNQAIELAPNGSSAFTTTIQNSSFTNINASAILQGAQTAGSNGTSSLVVSSNTLTGKHNPEGRATGIAVSGQEGTTTNLTINNNSFTNSGGNGVVSIDVNDTSRVIGTVQSNTIVNPPGIGMVLAVDEAATAQMTITGNAISSAGGDGIQLVNFGGTGSSTLRAELTNNTVNGHSEDTAVSFVGGISVTSFEDTTNVALRGNSVVATPASPTQCGGAPCVDYYIEEVGGTMVAEEIPNTAATTLTAAYVNSTNDAGPVTIFGVIDLSNGAEVAP